MAVSEKEVLARVERMREMAMSTLNARDPATLLDISRKLGAEAKEIESMATALSAQLAQGAASPRGRFEVVLTEAQRTRIRQATGIEMTSVLIEDASGMQNAAMPNVTPDFIESVAMAQASERAALAKAKEEAGRQIQRVLAELQAAGGPVAQKAAELRRNPDYAHLFKLTEK